MITPFDKSGIAAHFKSNFAKCLENDDFERAIDCLIKYSEEVHNADFHLACGMLYLQMALDSDDNELLCMAYREFMLHIRRFPDGREAYRDLLAALLLKRDGVAFIENCKWLKRRGIDFRTVMSELAETGVLFVSQEDVAPDFTDLFDGEYGEIDPASRAEARTEAYNADSYAEKPDNGPKIIDFCGGASGTASEVGPADGSRILRADDEFAAAGEVSDGFEISDTYDDDDEHMGGDDEFNDFINAYIYGDEYDEEDDGEILNGISEMTDGEIAPASEADKMRVEPAESADLIRVAEDAYEDGDNDAALRALDKIKRNDDQYYFALTMRALIYMEREEYAAAEDVLHEADGLKPHGALAGALLCQLYAYEDKPELIPGTLKNIDVRDYVNTAHLYKSFNMVLKYCNEDDAAELLSRYIEEFNIMEMRLVYAQIMYNRGEREWATGELYTISRIFYDDINARYFYILARSGIDRFAVDVEAPQSVVASMVENFMALVLSGNLSEGILDNEVFVYGLEFFLTLEYRNDKRLLVKMFDALRMIACYPPLRERNMDALVSPYAEPIVKAVILGELLANAPDSEFLMDISYCPVDSRDLERPDLSEGPAQCIAYAFTVALCPTRIGDIKHIIERTVFPSDRTTEECKAYYLFTEACAGEKILDDDRLPQAFGYTTRAAAVRARNALAAKLRTVKSKKIRS